jgi:hypothetical protein
MILIENHIALFSFYFFFYFEERLNNTKKSIVKEQKLFKTQLYTFNNTLFSTKAILHGTTDTRAIIL